MKKKTKRRVIWLVVIAVILSAGFLLFNNFRNRSMKRLVEESTLVKVEKGELILYSVAKGKITSADTSEVTFEGSLKENVVMIGDVVVKDQKLGQYKNAMQQAYNLRAKIDGIVIQIANNAMPSYIVANPDKLQMEVQISEKDIAKINLDQKSKVFIDALNLTVEGTVSKISLIGNTSTDFTTYTVTVAFDKGDNPIFLGMTGSAKIETLIKKDIYLVPVEALIQSGGKINLLSSKWFDNMNKPEKDYYLEVTVGSADIDFAEVSATGLEGFEAIILPESTSFTGFGGLRNADAD